ncbi:Myb-like DNA-binding domain protein [Mortierella sp. AD031]|nr:Myb-like DNA-binding domain protein [Mortierella sp. AD031]KAG0220021.1 Myb-like DNA-binding domain protein [Mortierella sp. NVP41]
MAFSKNQHLLQNLTSSLTNGRAQFLGFPSTGACNPLRNVLSFSNVTRRFYFPSLTTPQLQQTSSKDSSKPVPTQDATNLDDDKRARPSRPTRGQYHLLNAKRPRWTEEEKDMLLNFVRQGYNSYDIYTHFPLRTICSLDTRMAQLRTEEAAKGTMVKKPRRNIRDCAWSDKETEWLIKRLEDYGLESRKEEDVSWPEIANGVVDGKRLGRTATSCKRRWAIINPTSERIQGRWSKEEQTRLEKAILDQLKDVDSESPASALSSASSAYTASLRNKLGLALNGDHLTFIDWDKIAESVQTRTGIQCRSHANKTLESGVEGKWSEDEYLRFKQGMDEYGHDWHKVAMIVGTRSAFQTRQKFAMNAIRTQNKNAKTAKAQETKE